MADELGKKASKIPVPVALGVITVVFTAAVFAWAGSGSPKSAPEPASSASSSASSASSIKSAPPSTLDQLWTALDSSGVGRDTVHISYQDPSQTAAGYGGIVTLTRDDLSPWDSKTFVQDFLSDFVRYGQQAFKVSGVDHLDFIVNTNFTDDHGKVSTDIGMEVKMSKSQFSSFNWQNLAGSPVYDAMTSDSEYNYTAYSITQSVDMGGVILLLN
jgi:hypothetical protein